MDLPKLSNLAKGEVGEAYVLFRLAQFGVDAVAGTQNNPYDLVTLGAAPYKVQVKTSSFIMHKCTIFNTQKGRAKNQYEEGDFDILALYQYDLERVVFAAFDGKHRKSINNQLFTAENEYITWLDTLDKLKQS